MSGGRLCMGNGCATMAPYIEKKEGIPMDVHEKMHNGDLYGPSEALVQEQAACLECQFEFNHTHPTDFARREALLREMFAEIGPGCYIEPPLHANWAGKFVHLGRSVYVNFNLTLVDDTAIYIGDYTMIGPNVTIATGTHPILPALREKLYQFNMPVRIGRNCWLGAGAIILPGVTIGDNVVVGAGSVVTHDLPDNVVAVGNPCRVLRPVGERDREIYFRGRPIPPEILAEVGEAPAE